MVNIKEIKDIININNSIDFEEKPLQESQQQHRMQHIFNYLLLN